MPTQALRLALLGSTDLPTLWAQLSSWTSPPCGYCPAGLSLLLDAASVPGPCPALSKHVPWGWACSPSHQSTCGHKGLERCPSVCSVLTEHKEAGLALAAVPGRQLEWMRPL